MDTTFTPYKKPACSHFGEWAREAIVFTPSCTHRSLNKAFPKFLVWHLVNFYWLGKAEYHDWYHLLSNYLTIGPWQFGSPWGLPELIQRYISPNKSVTWNSINLSMYHPSRLSISCIFPKFINWWEMLYFLVTKLCITVVFLETVPSSQLKDK